MREKLHKNMAKDPIAETRIANILLIKYLFEWSSLKD
jgi:hypothetical protein